MRRNYSDDSDSPVRRNESPNRNRTTARIDKDRDRVRGRDRDRVRDRDRDKGGSNRAALHSPNGRETSPRKRGTSQSPSPWTKRLRRAQADREEVVQQKANGRDRDNGGEASHRSEGKHVHEDNNRSKNGGGDKGMHRDKDVVEEFERSHQRKEGHKYSRGERGSDGEVGNERKKRSSVREENDGKSSRVKEGRSALPVDPHKRRKSRSRSPRTAGGYREHSEVSW